MARIRLYVLQSPRTPAEEVVDAQGARILLPFLRTFSYLRIEGPTRYVHECVIDTGAPLTVFPHAHWQQFAADVEWLTVSGNQPRSWLTNLRGKTGGSCPCRVGRVLVTAFDLEHPRQELAPVQVIAQFELRASSDDRIIVGLHASILQGRKVTADPDGRDAWLEDR
jgi:hypothetical protein